MSLTVQLALGALAFMVLTGGFVWREAFQFDRRFGRSSRPAPHEPR